MSHRNLLLDIDGYKDSHWAAYPPDTNKLEAYVEPRIFDGGYLRFFGLQSLLMNWIENPITLADVDEDEEISSLYYGRDDVFPAKEWKYIVETYGGAFPVKISALPEGSLFKGSNLAFKVESTDERVPWVATVIETMLLRLWGDTTVCTNSYRLREEIGKYLAQTHDDPQTVLPFMLHDFGSRSVKTPEDAERMGTAHLVNFLGTDTKSTLKFARKYYNCKIAGYSIPAMEHSTVISWGRTNEKAAYQNFIRKWGKPGATIALVVDSYDVDYAVTEIIGNELKSEIINSNTKIMIRPDSGIPKDMVMKMLDYLAESFGYTINNKGFKVLKNVGVVQGDGVNGKSIVEILKAVIDSGYCVSNVVFGMGSALLQNITRDDFSFAFKNCLVEQNHKARGVKKFPKGDSLKTSKAGDLDVILDENGDFVTIDRLVDITDKPSQLVTYYHNGELLVHDTLDVIRARA
jgi:nicotinamide phosphoribosyltransferase